MANLAPAGGGLIDVRLPWSTLAGESGEPGYVSRIGPVTPAQARYLADLATRDPAVRWRVIVTGPDGRAAAVAGVTRARGLARDPAPPGPIRCVTLTITEHDLRRTTARTTAEVTAEITAGVTARAGDSELPPVLSGALRAAARAADQARERAALDDAAGGCAHAQESLGYRPPPRLRDYITARDVTCRFPTCRQPVWRCDLDHSVPFHKGGRTCSCNLGGLCRFHHQLKQHRLWRLAQEAGTFTWTTPAGRSYSTGPDRHAA